MVVNKSSAKSRRPAPRSRIVIWTVAASLASVFGATPGLAAGYTSPAKITHIGTPEGDGKFFIRGSWTNVDSCTTTDKFLVGFHAVDTLTSREMKLSLVLTAYSTGQTVELYLDGCGGAFPIVKGIYLPSRS